MVLGYNAIGIVIDALHKMDRFALSHILGALGLNDVCRHSQANSAVDASLSAMVVLVVGVECVNLVP